MAFTQKLHSLQTENSSKIKKDFDNTNINDVKIDIPTIITVLTIILPLCSFLYWSLFLKNFQQDYFYFCYAFEDVAYLLYNKGTSLWYITLVLAFLPIFLSIFFKDKNYGIRVIVTISVSAVMFFMTTAVGFTNLQIIVYVLVVFFTNSLIFFYSRNALYGYIFLIGVFLVSSAENDAKAALNNPKKITIILKNGVKLIDKIDKSKIYIGSSSKFVFIYDKEAKQLSKYERTDIL